MYLLYRKHTYSTRWPVYINFKQLTPTYLYHLDGKWVFGSKVGGNVEYAYARSDANLPQHINTTWRYIGDRGIDRSDQLFTVQCHRKFIIYFKL